MNQYHIQMRAILRVRLLDDEIPTSVNLGNDRGFIIKEYSLHWY